MSTFEKIKSLVSRADTLVDDMHFVQGYPSKAAKAERLHDQYSATTKEIKNLVHNLQVEIDIVKTDESVSLTPRPVHIILMLSIVAIGTVVLGYVDVALQPFSFRLIKRELAIQFVLNNICSFVLVYVVYFLGVKNGRLDILDIFNDLD